MLLVIPGSFLTFPITLFLPLALIWAVNDAWAFPINLAVVGNAQKLRALQPQDSRYNTSSRKLVSRTEVPEFESWEDYMDRYRRTIQDRHLLVDRLAKARKCVLDKVIAHLLYSSQFIRYSCKEPQTCLSSADNPFPIVYVSICVLERPIFCAYGTPFMRTDLGPFPRLYLLYSLF